MTHREIFRALLSPRVWLEAAVFLLFLGSFLAVILVAASILMAQDVEPGS